MKRFSFTNPILLLLCIFLLGSAVRFVGLGQNPAGIVDDEAEKGYDAYSLLLTGKDQWGITWPTTSFQGFGDYSLPAITYLIILPVKLLGLTPFAVRFPSALFGSLTVLLVYFLVKELFSKSKDPGVLQVETLALLSSFFLAISPWHIGMSRIAIEQSVSVFVTTLGLLLLLKGRTKDSWIIGSAVVFALSMFVYRPNVLLVPFLVGETLFLYKKAYISSLRVIGIALVCFVVIASPILLSLGGTAFGARANQVNLTNDTGTVDLINEKRGSCEKIFNGFVCKMVFNKYSAFGTKFVTNYFYHFSPNLLSIYGTVSQYTILPARGLLYLVDYPLFIISVIVLFSFVTPARLLLMGMLLFSAIPDSFTSDGHYGRFFISFPVWPILISLGLVSIIHRIKLRWLVLLSVFIVYCLALGSFIVEYWTFFPYRYSIYSHFGYKELVNSIENRKHLYDQTIVSGRVHDSKQYIFYLFYTKYDPAVFQTSKNIEKVVEDNGWVRVKRIDTIEFLPTIPSAGDLKDTHTLLIGDPTEFPKKTPVIFSIRDKKGDVIFQGVDSRVLYPSLQSP
jgi:4-amino-4-deoxy-L-arabinose transferase-like glycosyltransferase